MYQNTRAYSLYKSSYCSHISVLYHSKLRGTRLTSHLLRLMWREPTDDCFILSERPQRWGLEIRTRTFSTSTSTSFLFLSYSNHLSSLTFTLLESTTSLAVDWIASPRLSALQKLTSKFLSHLTITRPARSSQHLVAFACGKVFQLRRDISLFDLSPQLLQFADQIADPFQLLLIFGHSVNQLSNFGFNCVSPTIN